jgi:hypothetical protein
MYLLHREDMPPPASRCSPRLASRPMSRSNRESHAQASAQLTAHLHQVNTVKTAGDLHQVNTASGLASARQGVCALADGSGRCSPCCPTVCALASSCSRSTRVRRSWPCSSAGRCSNEDTHPIGIGDQRKHHRRKLDQEKNKIIYLLLFQNASARRRPDVGPTPTRMTLSKRHATPRQSPKSQVTHAHPARGW